MTARDRLVRVVGIVLLAGGLLALSLPVFLDDYDQYGIQVMCGNGYHSQLLQATVADQDSGRQSAPGGAPVTLRPATNYVGQCKSAVALRRAWAVPAAGLAVLILIPNVVGWARRRAAEWSSSASADAWSEPPDDYLHEAAFWDRRGRPHQERPFDTTL